MNSRSNDQPDEHLMNVDLYYRFGTALVIGLLIGLEREHSAPDKQHELFAGIRTFALLGVTGCLAALVTEQLASPWPFVVILLIIGVMLCAAYVMVALRNDIGLTTEVSAIITILTGALCYWNHLALAIAIGVITTLLLSLKLEMHRFAQRITQQDVYASLKFAVISALILPVLPNQNFGPTPFDVLNPYRIWLMVVFISSISFLGYILMKLVDARHGIELTGLLGGLVSSMAVTISLAENSRRQQTLAKAFALAILMSWTVMFGRVLVEVVAINPALLRVVWIPIASAGSVALLYVILLYFTQRGANQEAVRVANPFELGPAIKFGLIYAAILLLARAAEYYSGNAGLYLSSVLAGMADVNAITLSLSELSSHVNGVNLTVAARGIVLATMSNTLVKAGLVVVTGAPALRRTLIPSSLLIALAGVSVAFFLL